MNIALVTPEYVTEPDFHGGLANYVYRLSLALKELGHEPIVIVGTAKDEEIVHDGIRVFRVNVRNRFLSFLTRTPLKRFVPALRWIWQSWKLNQKLKLICHHESVDVAQFASFTATAFFRPKNIPSVVRISSFQPLLHKAYDIAKNDLMYYFELEAIKKADRLIGPSIIIAREIEKTIQRKVTIVETPYSAEPVTLDTKVYEDLLTEKKYLLFFGSIGLLKGVKVIADIVYPLLERHQDLFFVFAGKDMGYQGEPIMNYVWQNAGSNRGRVLYLGILRHHQLYPLIEHAQAVVLPSRIDNFPNTCLEAMAHGNIVIGTQGTSFEQLIEDGKNGFLCEIDNKNSLLEAIEKALMLSDDAKKQMGKEAKKKIDMLKPDLVVNKLIKIYHEVAGQ
jgi:glycosyltransferase involved in cell wall biosynthesis